MISYAAYALVALIIVGVPILMLLGDDKLSRNRAIQVVGTAAKWMLAAAVASIPPLVILELLLGIPRDVDDQPPWAWLALAALPAAFLPLAILRKGKWQSLAWPVFATLTVHGLLMAGLYTLGIWQTIAMTSLIIDGLLFMSTFRSLVGIAPGRLARATILWIGFLFGLGIPLRIAHAGVVVWRAESLADGQLYCVQVASWVSSSGYEPAHTMFDLSMLRMRAPLWAGGSKAFHFQHHALVVKGDGRATWNWSYQRERFVDEVATQIGPIPIVCRPEARYALKLPLLTPSPTGNLEVSIGPRRFSIPRAYHPSHLHDGFVLKTVGPDFKPYDRASYGVGLVRPDVRVTRDWRGLPEIIRERSLISADKKVAGQEFDLEKIEYVKDGKLTDVFFIGRDGSGSPTRFLNCSPYLSTDSKTWQCRHRFLEDGLLVEIPVAEPSQWKVSEQKIVELLNSFRVR